MGDERVRAPQGEAIRTTTPVEHPAPLVGARAPMTIAGGPSTAEATDRVVDTVTSGLRRQLSADPAERLRRTVLGGAVSGQAPGRIRASALADNHDVTATAIVRREYKSIGELNPEYAEPKFDGAAPKQALPELMGTKRFLDPGLDLLYKQAAEAAPEFKKKVNALAAATGGKPQYRSSPLDDAAQKNMTDAEKTAQRDRDNLDLTKGVGLKGRDRATEKAQSDYGSKATGLADILGGTVEYDSFPNMVAGFKQCGSFGLEIVREKNRLLKPTAAGYRDIMLNVRLSNGHIAELQFNLTGMLAAKAKGHKQYEEARKMEGAHKQSNLPLDADELAKLKGLYDEMRTIYQEAAVAAGAPVDPAELKRIFGA